MAHTVCVHGAQANNVLLEDSPKPPAPVLIPRKVSCMASVFLGHFLDKHPKPALQMACRAPGAVCEEEDCLGRVARPEGGSEGSTGGAGIL